MLHRIEVWALRWPGEYTQFLFGDQVLDKLSCTLTVVVLLQGERTTMSACGPRNEVILENVPKHHFRHMAFNVHERAHSQSRETFLGHNVTASMFHRRKDVVSVEFLAIRTTNIDNAIGFKHVEFGLVGPGYLHPSLLSPLYMLF